MTARHASRSLAVLLVAALAGGLRCAPRCARAAEPVRACRRRWPAPVVAIARLAAVAGAHRPGRRPRRPAAGVGHAAPPPRRSSRCRRSSPAAARTRPGHARACRRRSWPTCPTGWRTSTDVALRPGHRPVHRGRPPDRHRAVQRRRPPQRLAQARHARAQRSCSAHGPQRSSPRHTPGASGCSSRSHPAATRTTRACSATSAAHGPVRGRGDRAGPGARPRRRGHGRGAHRRRLVRRLRRHGRRACKDIADRARPGGAGDGRHQRQPVGRADGQAATRGRAPTGRS